MFITIGMIVLNEEECLERNLRQHYDFADRIVVVEGADRLYPKTRVTKDGLSVDRTAEIVRDFHDPDGKIRFVQHGWSSMTGEHAKVELRNQYMRRLEEGLLIVVDADEFYCHEDLRTAIGLMKTDRYAAMIVPQIHFWHDTTQFVTGSYYDVPHIRFWSVKPGDRYRKNHNYVERRGVFLQKLGALKKFHRVLVKRGLGYDFERPCCHHFGFTKSEQNVFDKFKYYDNRGEEVSRPKTFRSRFAWFEETLLKREKLSIHRYGGVLPECFGHAAMA
jgi:hypothetical protein